MFSTLNGTYFPFYMHFKLSSAICFNLDQSKILSSGNGLSITYIIISCTCIWKISSANKTQVSQEIFQPFLHQQILDCSKLKEFADHNFEFYENGGKVSESVENTGKRRKCSLRGISPFPTVFSNDLCWRHIKNRACLGKG